MSDTTGGFRCIRRSVLERTDFARIRSDGYAFLIEMNYRFVLMGAKIKEIPFFFVDRTRGTTKLTARIGLEALWIVWWLRLAHLLGRLRPGPSRPAQGPVERARRWARER